MAWGKPITSEEEDLIRELYGQLSATDIASRIGRSRSAVYSAIKRLGLGPSCARAMTDVPVAAPNGGTGASGRLADLEELRGLLRAALLEAGPQSIPKVAREYRETIAEIERLRDGGDGPGKNEDNPLGDILALIPVRA